MTCWTPKRKTPKLITAIQGPASGIAYNIAEIGVAITHIPTKEGIVIKFAKRIAVLVRDKTAPSFFCVTASEMTGTRLAAKDAVTIVGILTKAVAIPVRYPNKVVDSSIENPATPSLLGTINKSIFDTIGSIIFAKETGTASTINRFKMDSIPRGLIFLS